MLRQAALVLFHVAYGYVLDLPTGCDHLCVHLGLLLLWGDCGGLQGGACHLCHHLRGNLLLWLLLLNYSLGGLWLWCGLLGYHSCGWLLYWLLDLYDLRLATFGPRL